MATAESEAEVQALQQVACERVRDLYAPAARRAAAGLIRRHLDQHFLTVVELLHDSGHQRAFLDAGTTMTDAVQRAARAQVKGTNKDVTARVKALENLVDEAYKKMREIDSAGKPVDLGQRGLAGVVKAMGKPDDPAEIHQGVFRSLAQHLRGETSWHGKVARTLDLLPSDSRSADGTGNAPTGLAYIDALLGELVMARAGLLAIFGQQDRLSAFVQLLIGLYNGDRQEVRLGQKGDQARSDEMLALLQRFDMVQLRQTLAEHVERALLEPHALTGKRDLRELEALCHLNHRLQGAEGLLTEGVQAALGKRAYSLCHQDTLSEMLGEHGDPGQGLAVLLQAHPYLPGDEAGKQLREFLRRLGDDPQWVSKMAPKELGVIKRLRRIGDLNRKLLQAKLGYKLQRDLAEDMRRLEAETVKNADLFRRIESSKGTPADKATALIDLCYAGAFLDEELRDRARQLASKYVQQDGFVEAYLKGVSDTRERHRRLQQLARRLDSIGVKHSLRKTG